MHLILIGEKEINMQNKKSLKLTFSSQLVCIMKQIAVLILKTYNDRYFARLLL